MPVVNGEELIGNLHVWIDQDMCTGDGLCEEIAPDIFTLLDDGLAYVKEDGVALDGPNNPKAKVPNGKEALAAEAAEPCPGECIFFVDGQGRSLDRDDVITAFGF